jgi:acyl transferase domain-containing protein
MSAVDDYSGVALRRPVFVFSGNGGQWAGMGIELWDAFPAFVAGMEECATALCRYVNWSLEDVSRGMPDAPALDRMDGLRV